jgi:hypothetical protein
MSKKTQRLRFCRSGPRKNCQRLRTRRPAPQFTVASNNEPYFGLIYKNSFSSTKYGPANTCNTSSVHKKPMATSTIPPFALPRYCSGKPKRSTNWAAVAEAQAPLERVRARARAQAADPATALPAVTTTDQQQMRDAIRHERRVELGFELHRFFDLVRWGLAPKDCCPAFRKTNTRYFLCPNRT